VSSPEPTTTVPYVLSTLAETGAALAAFVGAVGTFRIQTPVGSLRTALDANAKRAASPRRMEPVRRQSSLIGFNYVSTPATGQWSPCALWLVAVGTVAGPLWCVGVWTEGVEK